MECHQAQAQLEFTTLGRNAVNGPDVQAAQRHLAECESCHRAMEFQQRFDSEVSRAMTSVLLPAGLTERLVSAVNGPVARIESPTASPRAGWQRLAGRCLTGGVLALLIPLLIWGWFGSLPQTLNEASVRHLAGLDLNQLPADVRQELIFPAGWHALREIQIGDAARLASVNSVEVPVQAFLARTDRRSPNVAGFLVRLPHSQWQTDLDATSFSSATIQYASFGTWVVWREDDVVFVCVLRDDAHGMQRLQELIAGKRDLT